MLPACQVPTTASHKEGAGNILRQYGRPLQTAIPRGLPDPNTHAAGGDTRRTTGRGGDSGCIDRTAYRVSGRTVRDSGGTPEGASQIRNEGEVPYHIKLGDPGNYNTGVVPRGNTDRGDGLDKNVHTSESRGRVQRYWVGGDDTEGVYLHHEHPPPLCHHTKWCFTWFCTRLGGRDSHLGEKLSTITRRNIPQEPFTGVPRRVEGI